MSRVFYLLFIIIGFISCQSPSSNKKVIEVKTEIIIRGEAQGTTYTIKYIADEYEGVKTEIDSLLKEVDLSMSTYIPHSRISKLNKGDTIEMDPMFQEMYALSEELNKATNGAFNPTIGPLIKAWGFDFSDPQKMDSVLVKELLMSSGFSKFGKTENRLWRNNEKARINFNAIAQGYAVDLMAQILEGKGIENYYVELGGELKVKGKNKYEEWWIIGIDQPIGTNLDRKLTERLSLENAAMATSGNYRKFYEVNGKRYSHTLNPLTGYPAENNLLSATVITDQCALSDALATAFMVMGFEKTISFLENHHDVQAYLITAKDDGSFETYSSDGIKEKFLKDQSSF